VAEAPDWRRVDRRRLWLWVIVWGAATVATGHLVLQQPVLFLLVAVALVFLFALVNGIGRRERLQPDLVGVRVSRWS
jgi:uncharacterized membrane protein HdeD (DUF308 family)